MSVVCENGWTLMTTLFLNQTLALAHTLQNSLNEIHQYTSVFEVIL